MSIHNILPHFSTHLPAPFIAGYGTAGAAALAAAAADTGSVSSDAAGETPVMCGLHEERGVRRRVKERRGEG